ncbi:Mitochondrial GTPase 1 [Didymosphaeria variabile]|uniref:Mitochondrial GTPase 1 n=1 Tax=Didymosphaeria variabile TaxID=1932322 RepID=A0A9W8XSA1_9PLEO|nr:Mitochondrial GTPase 1 [Didymosphaeria variabile]KAJ4356463.1 Mitochondrial GTPase 1 [Didymosphaeria variabile]
MAPLSTILVVALLAIGGVDAKQKDKVSYSRYLEGDCHGHPISGDIDDLKLKKYQMSKCEDITGNGVRFHKHGKNKYSKWINDVSDGQIECFATLYHGHGCDRKNAINNASLPGDFTKCNPINAATGSIQFWCRPNRAWYGLALPREVELAVTSYSIAGDGKAYPSVYTTAFNATRHVYHQPVDYVTETVTEIDQVTMAAPKLNARAEPTHKAALEPRKKKHNEKGVWMRHPWTESELCFKCWTKKELDYGKFSCRSGHNDKYAIDCGPKPAPVPPTSTHTITYTRSIEFWPTTTDQFSMTPTTTDQVTTTTTTDQVTVTASPAAVNEKRSPHKAVVLHHPWLPGKMVCADAEWENSGKSKAEVRIQKIKVFEKCAKKNAFNIDIGIAEYTQTSIATSTVSITQTTPPAWVTPRTTTRAPPQ